MKALLLFLLVVTAFLVSDGQNINLTGTWKDDIGQIYQIRQIDREVYWEMENLPEVRNVFFGIISGKYFSGKWSDLPGGRVFNYGSLSLQITNPDRFEKTDQSGQNGDYRGSVWTRTTNITNINFEPGLIVGLWDWQNGSGQLEVLPDGTFKSWVNGKQTNSGTWICTNRDTRSYTLRHQQGGWIDNMILSTNFNSLNGSNQYGSSVTGKRIR